MFLAYQPYKGPAAIPHVPGEFFGAFFLAINVSLYPRNRTHSALWQLRSSSQLA